MIRLSQALAATGAEPERVLAEAAGFFRRDFAFKFCCGVIKELEPVLLGKVGQLFRNRLESIVIEESAERDGDGIAGCRG